MPGNGNPSGETKGFFSDESGNRSMARVLLFSTTLAGGLLVFIDVFTSRAVPVAAYQTFGLVFPWLLVWAAGPRMVQYLAPQLGATVSAITGGLTKLGEKFGGRSQDYTLPPGHRNDHEREEGEGDEP